MQRILNHFSLVPHNWNGIVVAALVVAWLAVLGCVVSSILTQPFDRAQRIFWVALVVLLPFVGVLCYLPFSFRKEELPHIFVRKKKQQRPSRRDSDHQAGSGS